MGVAIFGTIVYLVFPSLTDYEISSEEFERILTNGTVAAVLKTFCSAFLYGAISTLPTFFLSSFCKNPYIITCLPFMLNYVWNTALSKIIARGLENGDWGIYDKLNPFMPDSIAKIIYFTEFNTLVRKTLIFNTVYVAILLIGFILVMNLRTDKGA